MFAVLATLVCALETEHVVRPLTDGQSREFTVNARGESVRTGEQNEVSPGVSALEMQESAQGVEANEGAAGTCARLEVAYVAEGEAKGTADAGT